MYADPEINWNGWQLDQGQLLQTDTLYGYVTFKTGRPLLPGDSARLSFKFSYTGDPFKPAASFNTIIKNGSFIRISKYFPMPGYNTGEEIDDLRNANGERWRPRKTCCRWMHQELQ